MTQNTLKLADSPLSISAANSNGEALKKFQITTDVSSKKDYMYGKNVAQSIYSTIYGNQTYFWLRNNRFRKNRQIANGKIDMSVFMDRLEMNSKANFVNINSEEARQKMRIKAKERIGDKNGFYEKSHSDESKEKIKESLFGSKHSEETKKKMRDAKKGKSSGRKGKINSSEHNKKASESLKKSWEMRKLKNK